MGLSGLSQYLLVIGDICLVTAFVLHIAHTTLLAAARRGVAAFAPGAQLAGAGGTATLTLGAGSGSRDSGRQSGPEAFRVSTTPGSIGIAMAWTGFVFLGLGMLLRAIVVGRGPWGNM